MKKASYSFPLKSRAAIVDFLTRDGRSYHYTRYRFAWNVKTYTAAFDGAALRKHIPGLDPALDSAWESTMEHDSGAFWEWCEDAGRHVSDGEWASYLGADQGDWEFSFAGRSGGWLVLEKWRGRDVRDLDPAELMDPEEWPFADLRAFYRGIVCADSDFTPANAALNVECEAAFRRGQWEEGIRDEQDQAAADMARTIAAARPDLAPAYA